MSPAPNAGSIPEFDDCVLLCPACGGGNLHQQATNVAMRPSEDQLGTLTVVNRAGSAVSMASEAAYVGRRDDVCISFSCESCEEGLSTLVIQQHKGATLMWWKPV